MNSLFLASKRAKNLPTADQRITRSENSSLKQLCDRFIEIDSDYTSYTFEQYYPHSGYCYTYQGPNAIITLGEGIYIEGYNRDEQEYQLISNALGCSQLYDVTIYPPAGNYFYICFIPIHTFDGMNIEEFGNYQYSGYFPVYLALKSKWEGNVVFNVDVKVEEPDGNLTVDDYFGYYWLERLFIFHPERMTISLSTNQRVEYYKDGRMYDSIRPVQYTDYVSSITSSVLNDDMLTLEKPGKYKLDSITQVTIEEEYSPRYYFPDKIYRLNDKYLFSYDDPDCSDFFKERPFQNDTSLTITIIIVVVVIIVVLALIFTLVWFFICRKGCFTNDPAPCFK